MIQDMICPHYKNDKAKHNIVCEDCYKKYLALRALLKGK